MGWLDSLLGDEQKLIESKDSDACETGFPFLFLLSVLFMQYAVFVSTKLAKIDVNPTIVLIE
jgi:hypothetical protein